jgi:hypothetical protein
MLEVRGTFRLTDETGKRTLGLFSKIVSESMESIVHHFGRSLFPGTVNLTVSDPPDPMAAIRDAGLSPEVTIQRHELSVPARHKKIGEHWFWPAFFVEGKVRRSPIFS